MGPRPLRRSRVRPPRRPAGHSVRSRRHLRGSRKVRRLPRQEPQPHALPRLPCPRPLRRFRRRERRLQERGRRSVEAVRDVLGRRWRERYPRPALLSTQRTLRGLLGATGQNTRNIKIVSYTRWRGPARRQPEAAAGLAGARRPRPVVHCLSKRLINEPKFASRSETSPLRSRWRPLSDLLDRLRENSRG